jgi:hypothetical protein
MCPWEETNMNTEEEDEVFVQFERGYERAMRTPPQAHWSATFADGRRIADDAKPLEWETGKRTRRMRRLGI